MSNYNFMTLHLLSSFKAIKRYRKIVIAGSQKAPLQYFLAYTGSSIIYGYKISCTICGDFPVSHASRDHIRHILSS